MIRDRKIFFVVASGGHDTDRHYFDTIKNKRTIEEVSQFLDRNQVEQLKKYLHNRAYAAWGAVPGDSNIRNWDIMEPGDYVMIYRKGKIILGAEVAMKVRNSSLAKYFWNEDKDGKTWEYIYFLINEVEVNVSISDLNRYFGYSGKYSPQGFMAVKQETANKVLSLYGDLISLLQRLERGEELEEIEFEKRRQFKEVIDEEVKKAPTEHDEIQWRLVRLGNKSQFDVWVPAADQNKEYEGNKFRDFVIPEFHEALDIPSYVKNIDTVWKLGLSVKAAFEIEHSTSIYSGILRLSDLRALAPNSNYPLLIVSDNKRKQKVFEQLKRPTFTNKYLRLDKVIRFLSYNKVREVDEQIKNENKAYDISWLLDKAELVIQ